MFNSFAMGCDELVAANMRLLQSGFVDAKCPCCAASVETEGFLCPNCMAEFDGVCDAPKPAPPAESDAHDPLLTKPHRQLVDLDVLPGGYSEVHGFSQPDWGVIQRYVESNTLAYEREEVWCDLGRQWLRCLRDNLGGRYSVREDGRFFLLSEMSPGDAGRLLRFTDNIHTQMIELLGDGCWRQGGGKCPLIVFEDEDDYFAYVSHFYGQESIPRTAGVCINRGYVHIGVQAAFARLDRGIIAHELTHYCVAHWPLPVWLNEGLAQTMERRFATYGQPVLEKGRADEHRAFWDADLIQSFWAGESFGASQQARDLSYSLAEILVNLLADRRPPFQEFLRRSHWEDAGQTAAFDCMGTCLGKVVAQFLGPGHWRPERKVLAACWERLRLQQVADDA